MFAHHQRLALTTTLAVLLHIPFALSAPPGPKPPGVASGAPSLPAAKARREHQIPPLTIAVPVFDPGLPRNPATWDEKGIWPELRRAETVYAAHKVQAALQKLHRFEDVLMSPDDSVSADLYLLGVIRESNGEDFALAFSLTDATGAQWLRDQRVRVRRPEQELYAPVSSQQDPFQAVWDEVARRVDAALAQKAKRHERDALRNAERVRKGRTAKMTELERVAAVRDLAFAGYFSPDEYGPALQYGKSRIRLVALPPMSGESWTLIQAVQARDDQFNDRLTAHYADFAKRMGADYALWQADAFPVAHERRKRREAAVAQGIAALLVAGTAAAVGADDLGVAGTTAAVVAAGALAVASFRSNESRREEARRLNELGASVNASMQPMNVEMGGRQQTLTGAAHEQFAQWRGLLKALYENTAGSPDAVRIISSKA